MEYISKHEVIDYLNGYLHSIGDTHALFDRGQRRALINAIQDISAVKSADVQPVKHGKWLSRKSTGYSMKCSICGNSSIQPDRYCGHCGARMDGDAE